MLPGAPSPRVKVVICWLVATSRPFGGTLFAHRSLGVVAGAITGPVQLLVRKSVL